MITRSALDEILNELANLNPPQTEFNSQLIARALLFLGNPQFSYPVIHIAGSNGKGSTAAFMASGLAEAGYRVGKYTTPYIQHLTECIAINQQPISSLELAMLYQEYKAQLAAQQLYLSSFEMLTLLMFIYFAAQKIDYLVLETGLGGRDDATNVVQSSYNVITNISLEHSSWLGGSLATIAAHKAGIIKGGKTIIADNCSELIAAVSQRSSNFINVLTAYRYSSSLDWHNFTTTLRFSEANAVMPVEHSVKLSLFGHFQVRNFLAAYAVLREIGLTPATIFAAAQKTQWPGRLQLLQRYPRIVADAAHNPDGCKNLYLSLKDYINPQHVVIICSILSDKDQVAMLEWYRKIGATIIFCRLSQQPRATEPRALAGLAQGRFKRVYVVNSPVVALAMAKRLKPQLILISGSTYLLSNFRVFGIQCAKIDLNITGKVAE